LERFAVPLQVIRELVDSRLSVLIVCFSLAHEAIPGWRLSSQ
jgi:hypothetical protein